MAVSTYSHGRGKGGAVVRGTAAAGVQLHKKQMSQLKVCDGEMFIRDK
jgi:hypothetical protein